MMRHEVRELNSCGWVSIAGPRWNEFVTASKSSSEAMEGDNQRSGNRLHQSEACQII
jgi:hypothetical protein